jgi:tetratricopeptide (TPR) repeat protein
MAGILRLAAGIGRTAFGAQRCGPAAFGARRCGPAAFGARLGVLLLFTGLAGCVERGTEHRIRANALFKLGDYGGALAECQEGLAHKPNDASLSVIEGKAAFELGDLSRARAAYERAVSAARGKSDVFVGDAYLGLAVIATREQSWEEARRQFLHLVEQNPHDAWSHANLAKVDLELGRVDEAVEHAEASARTRGNDEQVLFTLGKVYLAAHRASEAEKTFSHICEIIPTSASCPYGLALAALERGDEPRALAKLREAVDRKIPHPDKLAEDPALAPLQKNPDFVALASEAASNR